MWALVVRLALAALRAQGSWEWLRLTVINTTAAVAVTSGALALLLARLDDRRSGGRRRRLRFVAAVGLAVLPALVALGVLRAGWLQSEGMLQLHRDTGVVSYTANACWEGCQAGACERHCMNSDGFRGRPFLPKEPGTARVLVVGDSYVFGAGLEDAGRLDALLEKRLARLDPVRRWEAFNAGVSGLNFHSYVKMIDALSPRLAPDVVVIGFLGNQDLVPEDPWERLESYQGTLFALSALALVEKDLYFIERRRHETWLQEFEKPDWARSFDAPPPAPFAKMFAQSMGRLAALQTERGFGLVILSYYGEDNRFAGRADPVHVRVVWPPAAWNEDPRLVIADDGHPTAAANAMFAEMLAPKVIELAPRVP